MKKTINHLRQKPQHEKDRFAFIGAIAMTFLIVLFWLAGVTSNRPTEDQSANVTQPLDSFKAQFNDIVDEFKN